MQTDEDFGLTPSQTIGPFFHYGLPWKGGADLVGSSEMGARADLFPPAHYLLAIPAVRSPPQGEVIEITGRVLDGTGAGVPDAMIEIWQANAAGRYCSTEDARTDVPLDPNFVGFGRSSTGADGEYRFRTVRPGRIPGLGDELQAPHVAMSIFGRGLLNRLTTRLYFADGVGNDKDLVLSAVPEERRKTLIATSVAPGSWQLNLVLQGPDETVFFSL